MRDCFRRSDGFETFCESIGIGYRDFIDCGVNHSG